MSQITQQQVAQLTYAQREALKTRLSIVGWVGIAMLAGAGVLVWRKRR